MTVLGLAVAVASSSYAQRALESARKGGEPAAGKGLERPEAAKLLQAKPGEAPASRNGQRGLTLKTAATNPQGAQSPSNPFSQFQQVAYTLGLKGEIPSNFRNSLNLAPSKAFSPEDTPVSVSRMTAQIVEAYKFLEQLETLVQSKDESVKHITPGLLAQAKVMVTEAGQGYIDALKEFNTVANTARTANPLDDSSVAERLHEVSVAVVFAGNQLDAVLEESAELAKTKPAEALASISRYVAKTQSLADVVRGTALVAALGGNLDAAAAKQAVKDFEEACGLR